MKNNKVRRRTIALIAGCFLVLLLVALAGMGWIAYAIIQGEPAVVSSDIADYGKFESYKRYSNLEIFPAALPASAQNAKFFSFYQNTVMDPTYQIFLEISLSEADYRAEVLRLSRISVTRGGETHAIVYDTENFLQPAYVTINANNLTYEYAMLFEQEHKIVYVFTQFAKRKDIGFDHRYLPRAFQSPGDDGVDTLGGYNIYYFKTDLGASMEEKEWGK